MLFEYYVDDAWPYAGPNQVAVRTNKYKLIDNFLEDDIDELYDLIKDPGEMKNLINDDNYNNIEKELRDLYEKATRSSYSKGQYYYESKGVFEAHLKKFLGDRAPSNKKYYDKLLFRPTGPDYDNLKA